MTTIKNCSECSQNFEYNDGPDAEYCLRCETLSRKGKLPLVRLQKHADQLEWRLWCATMAIIEIDERRRLSDPWPGYKSCAHILREALAKT